jgi:hypothetical protein
MAKTVQWAVETEDTVLHALELRARREGGTVAEVVESVLRQALAAEIDEVSGTVPLAVMIQTVMRHRARTADRGTTRPRPSGSPSTAGSRS